MTSENNDDDADLEIPELPPDFFQNGVMGKYYDEYRKSHMVRLEADVARGFDGEQAVNDALRALIRLRRDLPPAKQTA